MTSAAAPDERIFLLDEPWQTRYEQMRSQLKTRLFSTDRGWGYALFVRSGLVAWMRAWPRHSTKPPRQESLDRKSDEISIPSDLCREVTIVVANMILGSSQGIPA